MASSELLHLEVRNLIALVCVCSNLGIESPVIVVSPKFLPELKKLPDNIVSMAAAVDEVRNVPLAYLQRY